MICIREIKKLYPSSFRYIDADCVTEEEYKEIIDDRLLEIFNYFHIGDHEDYATYHLAKELIVELNLSLTHYTVVRVLEVIKFYNDNSIPLPEGDLENYNHPSNAGNVALSKGYSNKYLVRILNFPERNANRSYRKIALFVLALNCYIERDIIHQDGPIVSLCFNQKLDNIMFPNEKQYGRYTVYDVIDDDSRHNKVVDLTKAVIFQPVPIRYPLSEKRMSTVNILENLNEDDVEYLGNEIERLTFDCELDIYDKGDYELDISWNRSFDRLLED
jgi:hypothetical protein